MKTVTILVFDRRNWRKTWTWDSCIIPIGRVM